MEKHSKFLSHTLQVLYMCTLLWFYKHQHDNRVRSKLFVACQRWWFQCRFAAILANCAPSGEMPNYCTPHIIKNSPYYCTGLLKMIVGVLTTCHAQYTWDSSICIFYLIEQHSKFLLHTLQVLYMCTLCDSTNINTIIEFVPNCL